MFRTLIAGAAAVAGFVAAPAWSQAETEFSLYSEGRFKGARTAITGPTQFSRPLVVRSLSVPAGTQWELCSGKTYTGCRPFAASDAAMIMTVRSVRPVPKILAAPIDAVPGAGGPLPGSSLRGMASEYFVAPGEANARIEVQPATPEAMMRRAADHCRARGWRSSAHARLQTVGGRVFLADVLCVDP